MRLASNQPLYPHALTVVMPTRRQPATSGTADHLIRFPAAEIYARTGPATPCRPNPFLTRAGAPAAASAATLTRRAAA